MCSESPTRIAVTVVVPVLADVRLTRLLESLAKQTASRKSYEVIVVENGSSVCEEIATSHGARYLWLPYGNMYAARNAGLRESKGEYILSTDSDCIVAPNWIEAYIDYFRAHPEIAALGGPVERYKPETPVQKFGANLVAGQQSLNYLLPIMPLPYVVTANCAYIRCALVQVGGYDDDLISGGDVDVCYKLGLAGYKLAICPNAVVYHDNRLTVGSHFRRFFNYSRCQALLFKKYRSKSGRMISVNPYPYQCVFKGLGRIVSALFASSKKRSGLIWTGYLTIIEGIAVLIGDAVGAWEYRVPYI